MQKAISLIWENKQELSKAAAYYFVNACNKAILKNGQFTVALSGGSTPQLLYKLLGRPEFSANIDWAKIFLFWSDERFVPHKHKDSNYKMVKESLLDNIKIPRKNIFPIPTKNKPDACARAYEKTLKTILGKSMQIDLTLLGMGEDGHTASLFPGTSILKEKKRFVKEIWVEALQTFRISFTYVLINHSKEVMFLVSGEGKKPVLNHVLYKKKKWPHYPVEGVCPKKKGIITWMLDKAAVGI